MERYDLHVHLVSNWDLCKGYSFERGIARTPDMVLSAMSAKGLDGIGLLIP